jgi:hypothetical protein
MSFAIVGAGVFFAIWATARVRREKYRSLGFHTTPKGMYFGLEHGGVNVPLNVAGVTDANQLRRSGEWIDLRFTTLHRVNTKFGSHQVPGHPVKVSWQLPDDPDAILRFHSKVPHHRAKFDEKTLYRENGLFPKPSFYNFDDRHQAAFLLAKIAPMFEGLPPETEPDFAPLFREYGIVVDVDEWIPSPPPPEPVPEGTILIGYHNSKPVVLTPRQREEHVYITGRSRMGKSTLMRSMILQDIEAGQGVALIDPHGDFVSKELLPAIPKHRENDVVLFSRDSPVPLNIFRAVSHAETGVIASDVIAIFKNLSESWGPRMNALLYYTVATLVRVPGSTFLDIYRVLTDPAFRAFAINTANEPAIGEYWAGEYLTYPKDAATPVTSRLAQFRLSPFLSAVLGQTSTFDFYDLMANGGIFVADIAKGAIGHEDMFVVGSLLIGQLQVAAMRRHSIPTEDRRPFSLYVDEFQNFKTSSFPIILSEASKYGLNLTMAHQYLHQLTEDMRQAVLGTVGTRIFFALGAPDARVAKPYTGNIEPEIALTFDRGDIIFSPSQTHRSLQFKTFIHPASSDVADPRAILRNTRDAYISPPVRQAADHEEPRMAARKVSEYKDPPDDEPGPSSPPPNS